MSETIKCPHCGSTNWRCWDERNDWYECECDEHSIQENCYTSDGKRVELIQMPTGYMACLDCGKAYIHIEQCDGCVHIGDDRQAGLDNW